ncbi:MAG TPA: hypothetical protein VG891_05510 [Rhizomicrobium sp.]|nr:hypothetical protein [Rhizomicrobium sp.]
MSAAPLTNAVPRTGDIVIRNLDSLLDQVAHPRLLEQGCVNTISIAPVRDKLGDRWQRACNNIYDRVDKQISRQLGAADYYCRISDTDYLLSFPGDARQSALLRCMRLLEELLELFLGEFTVEQIAIRTIVKRQGETLTTEIVDVATLRRMAAGGCEPVRSASIVQPAPARIAPAAAEPVHVGSRPIYLNFEYRPIWDLRHDAISSFSLNVIPETDQSRSLGESRADHSQLTPEELSAIDLASVRKGLETLTNLFRNQNRFILHLPCSYETLASSRARPQFLGAIKSFAPELRRYIAFELRDLPIGIPQSRLSALVTMLNPFGRGVIANIRTQRTGSFSLQGCGLLGAAIELESASSPEDEIFARIGAFRERAHMAGDQLIAFGVATTSLVMACWSIGLSHVSGDAVAPACAMPYQMSRFRPLDLYRR